jgi:hypothetical protein
MKLAKAIQETCAVKSISFLPGGRFQPFRRHSARINSSVSPFCSCYFSGFHLAFVHGTGEWHLFQSNTIGDW